MKDLSLHIMDIVQNSTRAGATLVQITIEEQVYNNKLIINIQDNGCGMDKETVQKVTDPFFTSRTTRKVGLGIPLFQQKAEQTGGKLEILSEVGKGTILTATFGLTHIDRPPWGDIAGTVALLASGHPRVDFVYKHQHHEKEFVFDTRKIKKELDDIPITHPKVIRFMTEMISENLIEIGVEV